MSSQITLYVRSTKAWREVQVECYKVAVSNPIPNPYGSPAANTRTVPYYDRESIPENVFVLSEDQQRMVEDARELASEHGFDLRVVDLTKDSRFSRWRLEHSKKIKTLPALVTGSGEIREGYMTKEEMEAFLKIGQASPQPKKLS